MAQPGRGQAATQEEAVRFRAYYAGGPAGASTAALDLSAPCLLRSLLAALLALAAVAATQNSQDLLLLLVGCIVALQASQCLRYEGGSGCGSM